MCMYIVQSQCTRERERDEGNCNPQSMCENKDRKL